MKRIIILIVVSLVTIVVFGGLVHAVLVATNLAEPAAATVYGPTTDRIWASVAGLLTLVCTIISGAAIIRATRRIGNGGRRGAMVALPGGFIGGVIGVVLLVAADGGPGTGNGVVAAAGAVVLGLLAVILSGVVLMRSPRIA